MSQELRALALLLDYPTETLQQHAGEIGYALAPDTAAALTPLLFELATGDLISLQERWLETFDRGRRTALNLFEHVHGDSRDRGQAMVDLLAMYEAAGIHYQGDQLPDYLPVFLDFLATQPAPQVCEHLAEVAHILEDITAALTRRDSVYTPLLQTLLLRAGVRGAVQADPEDDCSSAAIDAAYAEAPVNFLDAHLQTSCRPHIDAARVPAQPIQFHRRAA